MNLDLLYQILSETTCQLRKGDAIQTRRVGILDVTEIFDMPHTDEAKPDIEKVDMEMLVIGVDKKKAEVRKPELLEILKSYPQPERLKSGPSYIEVGAAIGDQGAAFQLFALGKILGLWNVITPAQFGMTGQRAIDAAGSGFIMMSGYDVNKPELETT